VQAIRNLLFYFSPLIGAALGGLIGLEFNAFVWIVEVGIGFGLGCLVSLVMIALSVRARFKQDPQLTATGLAKPNAPKRSDSE
jgi:hypothetical protein